MSHHYFSQRGSAARNTLIALAAIAVFVVGAVMLLPKGFSADLSVIGQGTPVVVLAHNKDSVLSLNLMDMLNKVRGDYDGRLLFRVVDNNTPQGRAFIDQQQVNLGTLLLFAPDGTRQRVESGIRDEATLRTALDGAIRSS
ncbi:MAG: hypothetical protein PVJ39_11200 [Gammaproteobacteria bacterium]